MEHSNVPSGIGPVGLLGVLFIGLKLTGYITWSWWWVTAPFWGGAVVFLLFLLFLWAAVSLFNKYL